MSAASRALCVVLGLFLMIALLQIGKWRSNEALWTSALRVSPQSDRAMINRLKARLGRP